MSKAKLPAKPDKAGLQLIIRHMVQAAGKTLADVSRELGHARTYVSTMLRDATTPGLDLFVKIANACGYDVLLVGHGEAHRLAAERIGKVKVSATRLWSVESAHVEGAGTCCDTGYDEGFASADDWLAEHEDAMAEHGWVRLPKDADGEVIHIGDEMEWCDSGETLTVEGIGSDVLFYIDGENAEWTAARNKRHHHEPTVEDVLCELLDNVDDDRAGQAEIIAEYAAKLRLAGDGDE